MIIDAHHHLWRLSRGDYDWLTPDLAANCLDITRDAYLDALRRRGLAFEPSWSRVVRPGEAGAQSALDGWLDAGGAVPTAALVSDVRQAAGLYAALVRRGLAPGRDFSLIAILPESPVLGFAPSLAAYMTDWAAIGVRLGDALIATIACGVGKNRGDRHDDPAPIQEIAPVVYHPGLSAAPRPPVPRGRAR